MISEDFAFFGFDETSWDRLASLFLGAEDQGAPRGVLVVVVNADDWGRARQKDPACDRHEHCQ